MKKSSKFIARILFSALFILFLFNGSSFSQDLNPASWPNLVGYWKFQDTSDLTKATVGNDLVLIGQHEWVAGAAYGDTAIRIDTSSYYKYYHGIAPNGGGDSVNQWSLMFDFKILSIDRWHCFFQTDTTNDNDGECFIRPNTGNRPGRLGVGDTGYSLDSILPNQWYRLVITANLGDYYNYYLNGVLLHVGDTEDIYVDSRFALTPAILFFADDHIEDDTIDIASLAIFDTCLTPAQIAQIGTIEPCIANPPLVNLGNDTTICLHDSIQLNAGEGFKSYLWSTGDTIPNTGIFGGVYGEGTFTFWVQITDMNNCQTTDSVNITIVSCMGLDETKPNQNLHLFPNPSNGNFNLILSQDAALISVYNSSGQKVKEFTRLKAGKQEINLLEFPDGLYLIKIQGKGNCVNRKILIVR